MPAFYVLHNFILPSSDEFRGGRRNCATFLVGAVVYAILWGIVMHLKYLYGNVVDSILSTLRIIIAADAATMAYEYRLYYGRSILHELNDEDTNQMRFDETTHKYVKVDKDEVVRAKIEKMEELEKNNRIKNIAENKKRIRAAKVIQKWWRARLYDPPNGIIYLRAKSDFENSTL